MKQIKTSLTIETRTGDSGQTDVFLERMVEGKVHREFLVLSDSPDTELFLTHLKRIGDQP